jgi:hypothetical protein
MMSKEPTIIAAGEGPRVEGSTSRAATHWSHPGRALRRGSRRRTRSTAPMPVA